MLIESSCTVRVSVMGTQNTVPYCALPRRVAMCKRFSELSELMKPVCRVDVSRQETEQENYLMP